MLVLLSITVSVLALLSKLFYKRMYFSWVSRRIVLLWAIKANNHKSTPIEVAKQILILGQFIKYQEFKRHVYLIHRHKGDVENPKGGIKGTIPSK